MLTKIIIVSVMLVILISLASALIYLVRDDKQSKNTAKSLSWRIGLSLGLFIFLFLAFAFEWITPHPL